MTNGNLPTSTTCRGDGTYPGAVVGGAPHAKLAPFGDIYFSFDFSTQFGYFLSTDGRRRRHVELLRQSDVDNDGLDAASQEADIWHTAFGARRRVFSTGNGAPGFGTTTARLPVTGIKVGASTQFGGTGWDSIKSYSQVNDNDVSNGPTAGPARPAPAASTSSPTAPTRRAT